MHWLYSIGVSCCCPGAQIFLQSVPFWSLARGDRVLCFSELKLGLIAQHCIAPGFCTLLSNLITFAEKEVQVCCAAVNECRTKSFRIHAHRPLN